MKTEVSEDGEIIITAETKEEAVTLLEWLKRNGVLAGERHLYDSQYLTFDARLAWEQPK